MFPLDVAKLLGQCTIVTDNARTHCRSTTESAEQLPPLRPYIKAKRTKSNNRSTAGSRQRNTAHGDRWTAEVSTVQSYPIRPLIRASASICNTSPQNCSNDNDLSPRLVAPRRLPSSDGMCIDKVILSPKRASEKNSSLNTMLSMSPRISDMSPRKPERRPPVDSDSKAMTAQLLRNALSIIDISE